ncbi:MAG: UDP-glucose 4-epimerase GalE [Candidatus Cloacimonetes bacterium]|nr:UDP-glucose 4-epimerase GalE [Candidatus Cloacimonadota bacterium]
MTILVTGGAGYIGSHTCVELINAGYNVIIVDNLSNSKHEAVCRVEELTGKKVAFYETNILDQTSLDFIFNRYKIDSVIHFAGLKAVGESVEQPLKYYHNNITGTLVLCEVMKNHNVKKIVFSSSATVYGVPKSVPITEEFPLSATNPYGRTKLMIEEILQDLYIADNDWNIALLRYFNPIGAHKSGRIGEDPNDIPNNLMPFITQVAIGKREILSVFGNDYETHDGTGVRDYIHVVDLAKGHLKALEKINKQQGVQIFNLGTGIGYSVLDLVNAFQKVSGMQIPYQIVGRRPGDVASCYADPKKSNNELNWIAELNIEDMCNDAWNWQKQNPNGYE